MDYIGYTSFNSSLGIINSDGEGEIALPSICFNSSLGIINHMK